MERIRSKRWDEFRKKIKGIGPDIMSEVLNKAFPDDCILWNSKNKNGFGLPLKYPDTFAVSKCQLYKSSQWSYEKEWRHIINKMNDFQDKTPTCIYHLRPNAIYYGTSISAINKKMLHLIAQEKGIKEYQMYIDNKSYNYSVKYQKI